MDEELIQEYLRRFDQAFSLLKNEGSSAWYIELTEEFLRHYQQDFADRMLLEGSDDPEVFSSGALIFYGYRLGAVRLKGKNECYTRQGGYMDNAIWTYNLDEILDEETEDDNPDAGASHIIEWTTNPGSNTDVSDAILGKMIVPMVKNLCKITPPGKRTECTIVMPPISKEIEIQDWSSLFVGVRAKDLQINLVNYGQLLDLSSDERKYILQYQTDGYREYVVVSAYEVIRGHNTCLGCMAFDVDDSDHQYKLQDIKPISLTIDSRREKYKKKEKVELENDWDYIEGKFPVNSGFNSFLGNHESTFGREMYKLSGILDDAHYDTSSIRAVFHGNEALQVIEVCTRLLEEQNLYNIALGDLVYIANILQRDKGFKTVSIGTSKDFKLGTYKQFTSYVDINRLHAIPSNFASFSWKVRDKRKKLIPYFDLDAKKHNETQIIESIVDHFEHCSTATVADEILYLYKDGEDPSAFFVAKVFMYLSQMDSLEIESRNEIVTSIENVDDIEYQEIDKSNIKVSKPAKTSSKVAVFKQQQVRNASLSKSIDEMEFTVRTYNCLRRAKIKTVGELTQKSRSDLLKVRNLGNKGQEEVIQKLKKLGLSLAGE